MPHINLHFAFSPFFSGDAAASGRGSAKMSLVCASFRSAESIASIAQVEFMFNSRLKYEHVLQLP